MEASYAHMRSPLFSCPFTFGRSHTKMASQAAIAFTLLLACGVALPTDASGSAADKMSAMTVGCGDTKACFVTRPGCLAHANCLAAVTVERRADAYRFEMRSLRGRYVSVALSSDTVMGDDAVVECVYDEATLAVTTFVSWNFGRSNRRIDAPIAEMGVTQESGSFDDNSVTCAFTQLASSTINGTSFDLDSTPYHLMLAFGFRIKAFGIGRHDAVDAAVSTRAQLLSEPIIFDGAGAGAAVRASAWLTLAAVAVRFASAHA